MIGREVNQQFPPRRALAQARPILRLQRFCVPDPHRTAHWAVRDASLEVGAGEVVGLAGLHGSGASELLQGLFGRWGPVTEGAALLEGVPFSVRSPRRSIRNGVALLTSDRQNTGLIRQMNLTENLTIAALKDFSPRLWLRRSAEREAALGHIHRLAIRPPWPEAGVASLSGGNQQKVLLARWLQVRPRLLLLDEPTRGVDVGAKHDIYQWMNEWTAEGAAILWISSELEELLAMSDRVLVMHRGRITAEYARDRIDRDQVLKAAMGEGRPC
jgi:ABC-type sugar transport system ATPase subunit